MNTDCVNYTLQGLIQMKAFHSSKFIASDKKSYRIGNQTAVVYHNINVHIR